MKVGLRLGLRVQNGHHKLSYVLHSNMMHTKVLLHVKFWYPYHNLTGGLYSSFATLMWFVWFVWLCFRYDPQVNMWFKVAPMSSRRKGAAVAVLDGYLYAIGGSDEDSALNTGTNRNDCITSANTILKINIQWLWETFDFQSRITELPILCFHHSHNRCRTNDGIWI